MTNYGLTMLRQLKSRYEEVFKNYGAVILEETYDEYGCEWVIRVDGSLFRFAWDYRDGSPWDLPLGIFEIEVKLGCPDAQSALNEWWDWTTILEFIAYVWNLPRPSVDEAREPHMIELSIKFIRGPNYQQWCREFDNWYNNLDP